MNAVNEYIAVRNKLTLAQLEIHCLIKASDDLELCGMSIAEYVERRRKALENAAEAVPCEF